MKTTNESVVTPRTAGIESTANAIPLPAANPGAKVARTTDEGGGIRVDLDDDGTPMGIEITAPAVTSAEQINAVLLQFGQPRLDGDDWAPRRAA